LKVEKSNTSDFDEVIILMWNNCYWRCFHFNVWNFPDLF